MNIRRVIPPIVAAAGAAVAAHGQVRGPSTQQSPYMLPSNPSSGVVVYSIASNGNGTTAPNETFPRLNGAAPYRLIGIPDGMGIIQTADDIKDGTVTITCNHELGSASGIVRDHGSRGASVSLWRINVTPGPDFLKVIGAQDMIQKVKLYNTVLNVWETYDATTNGMPLYAANTCWNAAGVPNPNANRDGFGRFCAGEVAPPSAFKSGSVGTDARIHVNGEENGAPGRAFAHLITGTEAGTSYELARFGDYSWENAVASPFPQSKTIVMGLDDSTPGNVYIHVGTKLAAGNDAEKAGLLNAVTYGLVIAGVTVNGSGQPVESPQYMLGNSSSGPVESKPFTVYNFGDCTQLTGAQLQSQGDANGVMNWLRPEDGAWDTLDPSRFYFLTTDSFAGNSRIWVIDFTDITQPELGGTVTMLGDGSVPATWSGGISSAPGLTDVRMMDNTCVTRSGQLLIQEDVGNNPRLGRLWLYTPWTDSMVDIGISSANHFLVGGPSYLGTQDEETSGVISAEEFMGSGWFFLNMQAHYGIPGELAEGGQLMAMFIPATQVGAACYANCDGSTMGPVVNSNDFQCFLNSFAAGDSYANCDGSTGTPALTSNDFQCFINRFAGGCS